MKKLLVAAAIAAALISPARADYPIKDGAGASRTIKAGTVNTSNILPYSSPVDATGTPYDASNPLALKFGTGVTLPSFATPQHFICDSGCAGGGGGSSYTVTYGATIGTLGTPTGFKDGSGNFQSLLGDVTNGQWVNIKASVPISLTGTLPAFAATPTVNIGTAPTIAVTGAFFQATQPVSGTFWQATQPVSIASSVAVTGPLTDTQLRASAVPVSLTSTTVTGTVTVSGTVTANLGTLNGAATAAAQTTGNSSLSSIDGKTPALGQALAAASVPVVLTAAQIATLTPLTSVGISGTLPAFGATPTFNIGTAPTIAVTGTFWQATQPISAAALPLPAGAATSAIQTGGTQKTQVVDGSGNVIGSTANALNVNTTNAIGSNFSKSVSPAVQNAAYVSNNALGAMQTVAVFNSTARASGYLNQVLATFTSNATVALTLYLFDTLPTATTCTDKTAFSLGAADIPKLAMPPLAVTPLAPQGSTATNGVLLLPQPTSVQNHDGTPTVNLYACWVVGGSVTPSSTSDFSFKFAGAYD